MGDGVCPSCHKQVLSENSRLDSNDSSIDGDSQPIGEPVESECPRCNTFLNQWEGEVRCWTCGYPDEKQQRSSHSETGPTGFWTIAIQTAVFGSICLGIFQLYKFIVISVHPELALLIGAVGVPILIFLFRAVPIMWGCLGIGPSIFSAVLFLMAGLESIGKQGGGAFEYAPMGRSLIAFGWMFFCVGVIGLIRKTKAGDGAGKKRTEMVMLGAAGVVAVLVGFLILL